MRSIPTSVSLHRAFSQPSAIRCGSFSSAYLQQTAPWTTADCSERPEGETTAQKRQAWEDRVLTMRVVLRQSYLSLLNECRAVDPIIGTGVVVEAPRIREDGSAPCGPIRMSQSLSAMGSSEEEGGGEGGDDGGADVAEARGREGGEVGEGDGRVEEQAAQPLSAEEERGRKWRWGLHQIGVDVLRTDRTLEIYEKEEQRGRLMEVLAVYAWLDTEVGYCQGRMPSTLPSRPFLDRLDAGFYAQG